VQRALQSCEAPPERGSTTAVAVGSANAEEGDEIAFLENLIKHGEKGAKPVLFVNSVKNALASQLALNFGWLGENQTFIHDALSFEDALWQGVRVLGAGRSTRAVVCGVEALCDFHQMHGHLLGHFRSDGSPLAPLSAAPTKGSFPGEGAAAFILAPPGTAPQRLAQLVGVRARGPLRRDSLPEAAAQVRFVEQAVAGMGASLEGMRLILVGANGDEALEPIYAAVAGALKARMRSAAIGVYRHRTGEFATASALGLSLAVRAIHERAVPEPVRVVDGDPAAVDSVLLYHLSAAGYHSAMVVSA